MKDKYKAIILRSVKDIYKAEALKLKGYNPILISINSITQQKENS